MNCKNDRNETPLHLAIGNESDSKEIVELLLQNKADTNCQDENGCTLHFILQQNKDLQKLSNY